MPRAALAVLLLILTLGGASAGLAAPRFSAAADRADARYGRGETVTFVLNLQDEGRPVPAAEVT
jgi:hypothetical protein